MRQDKFYRSWMTRGPEKSSAGRLARQSEVTVLRQNKGPNLLLSRPVGSKETIIDGKTGFLYKFDDPRELANNLNKIMGLDKDTLNLIGNEGRKNVSKKFDVEKMCITTLTEYKKLLNK